MRLGLGTVRFGLPYGVTNRGGQVPAREALEILELAAEAGLNVLDTAPSYGEAEGLIGKALRSGARFRVVTKSAELEPGMPAKRAAQKLREGFLHSLERLQQPRAAGLLLHRCAEALAPGGAALVEEMQRLKSEQLVERIGISIYDAAELDAMSKIFTPDIVQLPVSVINQSLVTSGHLVRLQGMGVEIHARSIFLQGALLAAPADLPPELAPLRGNIAAFRSLVRTAGLSPLEGALAFAAQRPEISVAIVGVTGREELLQITAAAAAADAIKLDFRSLASHDELRNPANWEQARRQAAGAMQ